VNELRAPVDDAVIDLRTETLSEPLPPPPVGAGTTGLRSMPRQEVWDALRAGSVGRLAFVVDGWPVVLPVNYALDDQDIVFRTAPGAKLAAAPSTRVAFEVDGVDALYEAGWSVLAFGIAEEVEGAEAERLRSLPLKPWAPGDRSHWIRVRVLEVTGRRIPRGWRYPSALPS
jgi:nitroimidazol reductase NimA-like FMN-containing flavoprotein (pyridoxamine 5'-phosphate oxidase superfamily)